jgi:hypothetical protein
MAKTAVKKPVKKPVKKSAVKKPATKKVVAKKPATKKAVKTAVVRKAREVDPNKHGKFYIVDAVSDKYPTMVEVTKAPKSFEDIIGKKYVSRERCIATLDAYVAEGTIAKGAKSVLKELDAAGIVPMTEIVGDEEK